VSEDYYQTRTTREFRENEAARLGKLADQIFPSAQSETKDESPEFTLETILDESELNRSDEGPFHSSKR